MRQSHPVQNLPVTKQTPMNRLKSNFTMVCSCFVRSKRKYNEGLINKKKSFDYLEKRIEVNWINQFSYKIRNKHKLFTKKDILISSGDNDGSFFKSSVKFIAFNLRYKIRIYLLTFHVVFILISSFYVIWTNDTHFPCYLAIQGHLC